jgi:hypothetical protein
MAKTFTSTSHDSSGQSEALSREVALHQSYDQFVKIFKTSAAEETCCGKVEIHLELERPALEWVAAMAASGSDFKREVHAWIATIHNDKGASVDVELSMPPLAYAVASNLARVAQALIEAGADPRWSFDMKSFGVSAAPMSILGLSSSWCDISWRGSFCQGLVAAELDRLDLATCAGLLQVSEFLVGHEPAKPKRRSVGL